MHATNAHFPNRRFAASLAIAAVVGMSGCAAAGDNTSGAAPAGAPAASAAPAAASPASASSEGTATAATETASAPGASDGAATPSHFDQLPAESQFQRFIVKYRDGTAPGRDTNGARERLRVMQNRTGVQLEWLRRLGVEADVFKTEQPLDREAAAELMDRFSADPDVEYIEVDGVMTIRTGVDVPPVKPLK